MYVLALVIIALAVGPARCSTWSGQARGLPHLSLLRASPTRPTSPESRRSSGDLKNADVSTVLDT